MSDELSPAKVRLTDGLGPLPEPVHREFREPCERYTAAQMRAYASQEVTRAHAEIERLRGIVPEVLERLNDELCAENETLRAKLQSAQDEWHAYLIGQADKHANGENTTYDVDSKTHYQAVAALLRVLAKQGPGA